MQRKLKMIDEIKKKIRNRKGFFFTVLTIFLLLPLIIFISFYVGTNERQVEGSVAKIKCDAVYYFTEDIKKDTARSLSIFGRRAAAYAINNITLSGNPLANYSFTCNSNCSINCTDLVKHQRVPLNGSEAAISELVLCGTFDGENHSRMKNHTMGRWLEKMKAEAQDMDFNLSLDIREFRAVPRNAWSFALFATFEMRVSDLSKSCFYWDHNVTSQSNSSIIGLEDPLYPLHTKRRVIKFFERCSVFNYTYPQVFNGSRGSGGSAAGYVTWAEDIPSSGPSKNITGFCYNNNTDGLIFSIKNPSNLGGYCTQGSIHPCFDSSANDSNHFEAIVVKKPASPLTSGSCAGVTIPVVHHLSPSVKPEDNLTSGQCIMVHNDGSIHEVLNSTNCNDTMNKTRCYWVSNISNYADPMTCPPNITGPSFFGRLDGRLNLSDRYQQQAKNYFNNTHIGIESLVNPETMKVHGLSFNETRTWIDYLYWQNITGHEAMFSCREQNYELYLDCPHKKAFGP